jgi:hypothetical protein
MRQNYILQADIQPETLAVLSVPKQYGAKKIHEISLPPVEVGVGWYEVRFKLYPEIIDPVNPAKDVEDITRKLTGTDVVYLDTHEIRFNPDLIITKDSWILGAEVVSKFERETMLTIRFNL